MTTYTKSGRSADSAPAAPAPPASVLCPPAAGPALLASPPSTLTAQPSAGTPPFAPAPGESPRAFAAFCAYLELGPRRRYATVARQVGASLISIKRWAAQFDWRQRLHTHAAQTVGQFVQTQAEERADTDAREKSLRERQLVLAEAVLDVTERYFERLEDLDLEQVRLSEVCRALEFASRLVGAERKSDPATPPDSSLRDQLVSLLDHAYRETQKPAAP
jgi:hypothetical protein